MTARSWALLVASVALGCGRSTGTLALDLGRETHALADAPVPTSWEVGFLATDGSARTVLGSGAWPSSGLDVDLDPKTLGQFDVSFVQGGTSILAGRTPNLTVSELPGQALAVFVQRRGELARPSADLDGRLGALLAVSAQRLVIVGGGSTALSAYDLALGGGLAAQALDAIPDALAATPNAAYFAVTTRLGRFDLETAAITDVVLPTGVAAGELSGGSFVPRSSGLAWVGPTRNGDPTAAIVFVESDDSVHLARLPATLAHATSAPLADGAVMVVGAGVAYRAATDGTATTVAFPQLTPSAFAALADGSFVAVAPAADGSAHAFHVAAGCDATCTPTDQGAIACATSAQLVGLGSEALLACDDASGDTRVFRLGAAGAPVAVTLREARRHATLVYVTAGEAALVGGGPASFERYRAL